MIKLNKKTQQDLLNREWVQRLLDAGVNMSDAKYVIARMAPNDERIALWSEFEEGEEGVLKMHDYDYHYRRNERLFFL